MILAALLVFRLAGETVSPAPESGTPRPVGSLQKPWVVAAWAAAHPEDDPPSFRCSPASRCWRPSGHGQVDLSRAFAVSCNAYFLALARATPEDLLARSLESAGFEVPRPLRPEAAIGLGPLGALPRISPASLLRAYGKLLVLPWPSRDELRLALLDGMRAAARDGTGAALGRRGYLVKTGTVPALDGRPLATSGWALAADPGGESLSLALLQDGTGAGAAAALGEELAGERSSRLGAAGTAVGRDPRSLVRVRLFDELRPASIEVTNAGPAPASIRRAGEPSSWLGPGGSLTAAPGLAAGPGLFRLLAEPYGLVRYVEGSLEVSGANGSSRLVLASTARAWVDGVVRGELREDAAGLREELAAAALRFLRRGRRHGREDVCDSTHCCVFVGRGPLVTWVTPRRAEAPSGERAGGAPPLLDDAAWSRVLALSERRGPDHFTGHCGGEPLAPYEVWGRGSREATPCPRHGPHEAAEWESLLPADVLSTVFGAPVTGLRALVVSGVRKTRVSTGARTVDLLYDDLHRALAAALGWGALPSPPDSFVPTTGGFRARGRGRGHRVGLCLAPPSR